MWFKLATANFADKNLGTMADIAGSWGVTYTLQGNISKNNCPTTVKMNDGKTQAAADFTATFTLGDGATLTSITATLKSSGATLVTETSNPSIAIPAASITGDIVITAIASGTSSGDGAEGGDTTTTYTITYKYMSGATEIKTATTETGIAAGTTKTFSTSNAPAISGYTVSSVSPSGSQTINSNLTVTYYYTANENAGTSTTLTPSSAKSYIVKADGSTMSGGSYRNVEYTLTADMGGTITINTAYDVAASGQYVDVVMWALFSGTVGTDTVLTPVGPDIHDNVKTATIDLSKYPTATKLRVLITGTNTSVVSAVHTA